MYNEVYMYMFIHVDICIIQIVPKNKNTNLMQSKTKPILTETQQQCNNNKQ